MTGFVYKWTNTINNKWYIGSHKGTIGDGYRHSSKILLSAEKKYGKNAFCREILFEGDYEKDDIRKIEATYLNKYNAANNPMSYNQTNITGLSCVDQETRDKMSISAKEALATGKRKMPVYDKSGDNNPMAGKTQTASTKLLMSKKRTQYYIENPDKKLIGEKNGMYGKQLPLEQRQEHSERIKKMKWYNDGNTNLYIKDGDSIPSGFIRGRITGWNTAKKVSF